MGEYDQFVGGWTNINKGYYDHVNEIIVGLDIASYKDDPFAWRKFLRMVYRKVHKRLKDDSLLEIDKHFKAIDLLLDWSGLGSDKVSQDLKVSKALQALQALDQLEILLLDEMHEERIIKGEAEQVPPERAVEDFGFG